MAKSIMDLARKGAKKLGLKKNDKRWKKLSVMDLARIGYGKRR